MRGGKRKGAGRPKGSALADPKKQRQIRFNEKEFQRITEAAEREGTTFSDFVRRHALNAANRLIEDDGL